MSTFLSIVVVVKDDLAGIKKTLRSLERIDTSTEVIVIDGSIELDLKQTVSKFLYSKNFRYIYQEPLRGL